MRFLSLVSVFSLVLLQGEGKEAKWAAKGHQQERFSSFSLRQLLPAAGNTLVPVPEKSAECPNRMNDDGKPDCPGQMLAYDQRFDDCGDTWRYCHCDNTPFSPESLTADFARVPIGVRRMVNQTNIYPMQGTSHGLTYSGDRTVWLWLNAEPASGNMLFHESLHASDYSSDTEWEQAISADAFVADPYSKTSNAEAFAQAGILMIYSLFEGQLPEGFTRDKMAHQFSYLEGLNLFQPATLFGNTCAFEDGITKYAKHTKPPNPPMTTDGVQAGTIGNSVVVKVVEVPVTLRGGQEDKVEQAVASEEPSAAVKSEEDRAQSTKRPAQIYSEPIEDDSVEGDMVMAENGAIKRTTVSMWLRALMLLVLVRVYRVR